MPVFSLVEVDVDARNDAISGSLATSTSKRDASSLRGQTADGAEEGKGVRESSRTTEEGVREDRLGNDFTV